MKKFELIGPVLVESLKFKGEIGYLTLSKMRNVNRKSEANVCPLTEAGRNMPFNIAIKIGWVVRSGDRIARLALGWFGLNYLLVANIVPIPSFLVQERYLYLPAVGLWLLAGTGFARLLRSSHRPRRRIGMGFAW